MRAITVTEPGGPEQLAWTEVPDLPPPGPGEVLVDVAATAVNRADIMQRQGLYPPPKGASQIIGLELSGRVAALGPDVVGWSVGQEVCALLSGGGYAEQALVPVGQLLPVPAGVDLVEAAALPEVACTVWANVTDLAHLRAGELLLVHGGSSGIGTFAVQYAGAVVGARVAVTARSQAKLDACAALGAEVLIDYTSDDFVARVREATDGAGADVVLDTVGAKYLGRNVDVLATGGRLAVIGLVGGARAELDLGALMMKRGTVIATTLRSRPVDGKAAVVAGVLRDVWPAVADGRIRPVIDSVLPIAQAADAHTRLETSDHIGKLLLAVG